MNMREWLKKLTEKGARNNANDATMIQTMHDHSVALGASCAVDEAANFSNNDVMTLLNNAVKTQFKAQYSYPYIHDVFDEYLVFGADYSQSNCYKCDYSVSDSGVVTLGTPIAVVRKVTYIEPNTVVSSESDVTEAEITSDCVQLVENGDNTDLVEANTRMLKLIAPGWGSSGYYPADVLKRDGPQVFKAGTHNYIDHLTSIEEKTKPEGYLDRLASVLIEDAHWEDDYNGNGAGLYAKAKVKEQFNGFLNDFGTHIGTSIRANGKVKVGEANGRKGPIIEAITSAKSVDYVTVAGAGGKVLDLIESAKHNPKTNDPMNVIETEKEPNDMSTEALQETINRMNAKFVRNEARDYARAKLSALRVKDAVKDRIVAACLGNIPLDESGEIKTIDFDVLIEAAIKSETEYLTSVGAFGKISGFGGSAPKPDTNDDADALFKTFQESVAALD